MTNPAEWEVEYDNDTGPGDESFAEWFDIGPLRYHYWDRAVTHDEAQAFAEKVKRAMVCHDELLAAAKQYRNECFMNSLRNCPKADWYAFVREMDALIEKASPPAVAKEATR